jgi:hypothetical protein
MMSFLTHILIAIVGAFYRRAFGGWETASILHIVKVIIGYVLMFGLAFEATHHNIYAALAFSGIMGSAFLNPLHSWGMAMGGAAGRPLWACVAVMGGSYGLFTTFASVTLVYITNRLVYAPYAITGFLTPLGYLFGYWFFDTFRRNPDGTYRPIWQTSPGVWFIDVPTAIGELGIGSLLFSL